MTERRVTVTAERPYDVIIGGGVRQQLTDLISPWARVAVFYPEPLTTVAQCLLANRSGVHLFCLPDAEAAKTPEILAAAWRGLAQVGLTRDDVILSLGGGATTDVTGFIAATWLRGVDYISVPTTVLAMADAAVGGKTGVNLPEGKNLVGAFYEPRAVLCDLDLLQDLPSREVVSGLAEIIKCGLIADSQITNLVVQNPAEACQVSSDRFADILSRAIQVKADVVSGDFREAVAAGGQIGREALNYGHTLAHAIEQQTAFSWRHGEAVSVGLVWAAAVAQRLGLLTPAEAELHRRLLAAVGLPVSYQATPWNDLRPIMSRDKKARGHSLRLVLLDGLNNPVIRSDVDEMVLADAYRALAG
ncbi:MAG: 3-dehydroquinate synthase [Propionibacteriaceae bacterium]|jgi:3-dehydroquinate synthase|nr:3-dehydroquinate synthase [Propionibacteriaceae bacterium]